MRARYGAALPRVIAITAALVWLVALAIRAAAPPANTASGHHQSPIDAVCLEIVNVTATRPVAPIGQTDAAPALVLLEHPMKQLVQFSIGWASMALFASAERYSEEGRSTGTLLALWLWICTSALSGVVMRRAIQLLGGTGASANALRSGGYAFGWPVAVAAAAFPLGALCMAYAAVRRPFRTPLGLLFAVAALYAPLAAAAWASPAWFVRPWENRPPEKSWAGSESIGLFTACNSIATRDDAGNIVLGTTAGVPAGVIIAVLASFGLVAAEFCDFAGAPIAAAGVHVVAGIGPAVWAMLPPRMWYLQEAADDGTVSYGPVMLLVSLAARAAIMRSEL